MEERSLIYPLLYYCDGNENLICCQLCFGGGIKKLNLLSAVFVMKQRSLIFFYFQFSCIFCISLSTVCFCDRREKLNLMSVVIL